MTEHPVKPPAPPTVSPDTGLRARLAHLIPEEPPAYLGPRIKAWRDATDAWLFVFAAASLPLVILELQRNELTPADRMFTDILNWVIFGVFAFDYVIEIVKSEDWKAYMRGEKLMGAIVITSAIALVPAAGVFGLLRVLRILRPLNGITRLVLVSGFVLQDGTRLLRRKVAKSAFAMGGLVWASAAAAYLLAERAAADNPVTDYPEALWWSFTTMVAGETYAAEPGTLAGRLIAGFTMVVGLAVIAVVIATIASIFVETTTKVSTTIGAAPAGTTTVNGSGSNGNIRGTDKLEPPGKAPG